VLADLTEPDAVEVSLDADTHDRGGAGVELEHDRSIRFLGQTSTDPVQTVPHVVGRLVQIGAPGEVQRDAAGTFRGGRLETLESRGRAQRLFKGPGDQLLHLERTDTGITHANRDARKRHIRHQVHRQPHEREGAKKDHDPREHEHRDRTVNG
jgi:hypothetical protein